MVEATLQPQGRQEGESRRELELSCMSNLLSTAEERVYFKDLMSRFLLVSAGWIAAYAPGRAAEELIGKTDFDVFSDQHASAAFDDEQQIIRTGEPIVGKVERERHRWFLRIMSLCHSSKESVESIGNSPRLA